MLDALKLLCFNFFTIWPLNFPNQTMKAELEFLCGIDSLISKFSIKPSNPLSNGLILENMIPTDLTMNPLLLHYHFNFLRNGALHLYKMGWVILRGTRLR